jgi:hypothetical protein
MANEYNLELQKLYLEFLQNDKELFVRCNAITDPIYFDRSLRPTVRFIQEHAAKYNALPTIDQVTAKTGIVLNDLKDVGASHHNWFLDEYETFCRHKALEHAIISSTDLLDKKEYGAVEKMIKEAVAIGLSKVMGANHWDDPLGRLRRLSEQKLGTSTGWKTVDAHLNRGTGFLEGELNIFAGGSGSGKSLFMQNIALNWSKQGKNVLYVSLELSEDLCSMRIDSMVTGVGTKELFQNKDDSAMKIAMAGKKAGRLQIVQMPNGCNVNDIRAYVKEFEIQNNLKINGLLIDYLDLMSPMSVKINPSDMFVKDKYVSEELRNLAIELNVLFVTASQLNRSSVDEVEFDHSHISGGISKINTADNVIGIFTSKSMRENGRAQIQFMKTRSSAGVGRKVDLGFDISCLRIFDLETDDDSAEVATTKSVYQKLSEAGKSVNGNTIQNAVNNERSVVQNTDRLKNILKRASE